MTLPLRIGRAGQAGPAAKIRSVYPVFGWLSRARKRRAVRRARRGQLRAGLGLAARERLLDAAPGPDGGYALAVTDRALYHRASGDAWTRLGWEMISAVTWASGHASVAGLWGHAAVPLRDRGGLPEIAAERITHTRLGSWRVTPPAGRPVLIEARRRPVTGEVLWFVSAGTSRAEAERVIARLGAQAGLPPRPPLSLPWR